MNNSDLAIVIPAYKLQFFEQALNSIASQSNQNFTVYIGDDDSKSDLFSIFKKFEHKINIKYYKFDTNLGGTDLVAHWERCIQLTEKENWIWLFSDDDIMTENCVKDFYECLEKNPNTELFHFDIEVINAENKLLRKSIKFPKKLNVSDFNLKKWRSELFSYVVEYIFSRQSYHKNNGFQNFPFAWHSDIATWTKLGHPNGILTIQNSTVKWRSSSFNLTPNNKDLRIVEGKMQADVDFAKWIKSFYEENHLPLTLTHRYLLTKRFIQHLSRCRNTLPKGSWKRYIKAELGVLDLKNWYLPCCIYYQFRKLI